MSALDWLVIAGGAVVILWVNWYFFLAERRGRKGEGNPSRG